jgi:outer membrane protein assembly factor BamD
MKIMRYSSVLMLLFSILWLGSCKTEFERIRTSTDAELIYNEAMGYFDEEEYLKAQTLFELILNNFRGSAKAEQLSFRYAYTQYYLNSFLLASHYFDNFSNTFTSSSRREEADFMRAYSNYLLSPSFRLDQQYTSKAIDQFQLFVNTYPNSDRAPRCNDLIDECRKKLEQKAYEQGKLYFDLRNYTSAVHSLENLLKDFPESVNAEEVRFMILKSAFLLAENSFYERQKERYEQALDKYDDFTKKFPSSTYKAEAREMRRQSREKLKTFDT